MLKQIIDAGLSVLNVVQLANNLLRDERDPQERRDQQRVNRAITNVRNAAYLIRRTTK